MCAAAAGRAGRPAAASSIVIVAEGATRLARATRSPATYVRQVLEDRLGEDARVTILGHVQRGGAPSAFDRSMSTLLGYAAVDELLAATPDERAAADRHRGTTGSSRLPLMECVAQTREVAADRRGAGLRQAR